MDINANFNVNINKQLQYLPQSIATSIAAGGFGTIITPPAGQIGRINSLYINVPANGGSGSQDINIYVGVYNLASKILTVTSNYLSAITIQGLSGTSGTPVPASDIGVAFVLNEVRFDNANLLVIQ
jgi:hypothetical protein